MFKLTLIAVPAIAALVMLAAINFRTDSHPQRQHVNAANSPEVDGGIQVTGTGEFVRPAILRTLADIESPDIAPLVTHDPEDGCRVVSWTASDGTGRAMRFATACDCPSCREKGIDCTRGATRGCPCMVGGERPCQKQLDEGGYRHFIRERPGEALVEGSSMVRLKAAPEFERWVDFAWYDADATNLFLTIKSLSEQTTSNVWSLPVELDIRVKSEATLPDGTKIELPAGAKVVLLEQEGK